MNTNLLAIVLKAVENVVFRKNLSDEDFKILFKDIDYFKWKLKYEILKNFFDKKSKEQLIDSRQKKELIDVIQEVLTTIINEGNSTVNDVSEANLIVELEEVINSVISHTLNSFIER